MLQAREEKRTICLLDGLSYIKNMFRILKQIPASRQRRSLNGPKKCRKWPSQNCQKKRRKRSSEKLLFTTFHRRNQALFRCNP